MDINLSDVIKNDGSEKSFCEKIEIEPVKYMGLEVLFKDGAEVRGTVRNVSGVLEMSAVVTGKLVTSCARCLKTIEKGFRAKVAETLVRDEDVLDGNEDVIVFSGQSVPIDEIVLNSILASLEVRYLCSPDCKGLCPKCGKNLNEGECKCCNEEIDPRLEVLSRLL